MKTNSPSLSILRIGILLLFIATATTFAYSETRSTPPTAPASSPVGQWIVERPSKEGIGSWWDFHPDGTFAMHIGVILTTRITRSGDTFTSPATNIKGSPVPMTWRVEGTTLHVRAPHSPEQTFTRIGPPPSATDSLLGKWKPSPPAALSSDPNVASEQKLMASATLIFSADNTETLRVPFSNYKGVWDAATHTFHINNQTAYSFQRMGEKLALDHTEGHKAGTYIADTTLDSFPQNSQSK
jgi:hypothetical protein